MRKVTYRRSTAAAVIERVLLAIGIVLLVFVLAAYVHQMVMVRSSIRSFERARHEQQAKVVLEGNTSSEGTEAKPADRPATASSFRVQAGNHALLAVLRIPKIHLEAPVLQGTDKITLNRGIGQIAGTAIPGGKGNIGLAGHRDGLFRNLKEITRGDVIELETTNSSATYVVTQILITDAEDTSVLKSSDESMLTLVTCYPFHVIGPAPRRFIVQASLK